MTRLVLAGIDGSAQSLTAARWAADEAVLVGHRLRLIHSETWQDDIYADPGRPADNRALTARVLADAEEAVRQSHPGLAIDTALLGGEDPVDSLVAASDDCELMVLGSHGLGGFRGLMVGSIGLAIAARSESPVVLVRSAEQSQSGAGPDAPEVVVGVDAHAPCDAVLEFAFRQASVRGATLRAVHGWNPPPSWGYAGWVPPQTERAQFQALEVELLSEAVQSWREKYPDIEVLAETRPGGGAAALADTSTDAALVVVGRRRRPHRVGMRLGPVAHAVIHHAHAPVAIVPHD